LDYPTLLQETTALFKMNTTRLTTTTAVDAISLLRKAGVPADTNNYGGFQMASKMILLAELPDELRRPLTQPNEMQRMMIRQLGGSLNPYPPKTPAETLPLWRAVADALAPASIDTRHKVQASAAVTLTDNDLQGTNKMIEELSQQLTQRPTADDLRAQLASASQRKTEILEFRAAHE
jgi:hypothetical protein